MKNIVCFGEVLWDVFPEHKKIGGAPLNVAVRLQSLGNHVSMISSVGQDADGDKIIDFVKEHKVDASNIQINPAQQTGSVAVTLDNERSATYEIEHPRAWDKIELSEKAINRAKTADAFIYGSLAARDLVSRNTLYELLKIAPYKIFDVNLRKPHYSSEILNELMHQADFIKFNDDEILEIVKNYTAVINTVEEAIQFIAQQTGATSICVTKGSKGAVLYYSGKLYQNPGYKIKVVDTVGAGDSFLASLINQLLNNSSPQKAIDFACAVGAIVASREGANPKIDKSSIDALMMV
ncbi:carbohydrate kinase [Wenyingzhuangia fucanilytica]|uniref:Carbohydrate kinase n=1 Tax=Wenyingzhuangia fucanilytica TaxID=1790137 RepID=A0A1B1Y5C8_9FLAO|nr:carbohydrate kinase [Wenyingzhuangia fucanilytica]ANW95982.1 carbohydrate kinase [Wenyingzhuangia fucanilytica]